MLKKCNYKDAGWMLIKINIFSICASKSIQNTNILYTRGDTIPEDKERT